MLYHHDSRPYAVAAADATQRATDKLNSLIDNGRNRGAKVIEKVMSEVPTDNIVRGSVLKFDGEVDDRGSGLPAGILAAFPEPQRPGQNAPRARDPKISPTIADILEATPKETPKIDIAPGISVSIHKHALGQICARVELPWKYAQMLSEPEVAGWGLPLLAKNLNELYRHQGSRFLLRSYNQQLRGFLSDKFRRLDSRPLVEAFAEACQAIGAVPVEGYATDTKVALKAMLPQVFRPTDDEVLAFGVIWENSDYGNGAHAIRAFMLRLWCTNYAITDESLRQVHLGKRLTDDIVWSNRTHELDTQALASAVGDVVKASLSAEQTTRLCDVIKEAHTQKINPKDAIERFKKDLTKGEIASVTEAFNSPDVENLPPGNTLWRMSNAVSWVANQTEDVERKLDLMKVAGKVMSWVKGGAA